MLRQAMTDCIASCGKEESNSMVCSILNDVFGKVPTHEREQLASKNDQADSIPAKRRKLELCLESKRAKLSNNASECSAKVGKVVLDWCAELSDQGRFSSLANSPSWLELHPGAVVAVVGRVLDQERQALSEGLLNWVNNSSVSSVFGLLTLAGAFQPMFDLVVEAAMHRFVAMEQQNAVLEGGKYRQEIETAVEVARSSTAARLDEKFHKQLEDQRIRHKEELAEFHKQLEDQQIRHKEELADQQRRMEDFRSRIYTVLQAGA